MHLLRRVLATVELTVIASSGALAFMIVAPAQVDASSAAPPACTYADIPTVYSSYSDWAVTLLDTTRRLPSTYSPPDLVSTGLPGGGRVRSLVKPDLLAMARAASAAGAPLQIASAFRSYSTQASTFRYWVRVAGLKTALLASARPGHSEHQLGTAIDFTSRGGSAPWLYSDWAKTKAGAWMAQNAWEYGFIMSYPKGKSPSVTCYKYEPWHYRYVGRAEASAIHSSGLTTRQWLWDNTQVLTMSGLASPRDPGSSSSLTVTVTDASGETVTGYHGTVHFTSTDRVAVLPPDYTFTATDAGVHIFHVTLKSAGTQSITATDTAIPWIGGSLTGIVVRPAAASTLALSGLRSPELAGTAGLLTVTARDAYGNTATGYRGTVHFTSSDARAVLPADYTFTEADNGVHVFHVTLRTAGTWAVTATDKAAASIEGSQSGIVVS